VAVLVFRRGIVGELIALLRQRATKVVNEPQGTVELARPAAR
jgi:hypothetical protein